MLLCSAAKDNEWSRLWAVRPSLKRNGSLQSDLDIDPPVTLSLSSPSLSLLLSLENKHNLTHTYTIHRAKYTCRSTRHTKEHTHTFAPSRKPHTHFRPVRAGPDVTALTVSEEHRPKVSLPASWCWVITHTVLVWEVGVNLSLSHTGRHLSDFLLLNVFVNVWVGVSFGPGSCFIPQ